MNQLPGRFVVIVLSIREGRGFIDHNKFYILEATLSGRKIVSDPVEACINPLFCTELVWEIAKTEIRKLRSSHTPLRIECFTVDEYNSKEKIGYVLLHLRSARPVTTEQLTNVEYKWNKLLGVHIDYKALHPEVSLTLTIRDKMRDIGLLMPPSSEPHSQLLEMAPDEKLETQSESVHIKDGYIQLGDGDTQDTFSLSFYLDTAYNLDILVENRNIYLQETPEYFISLMCFDMSVNSKKFINLHEPVLLNEKFVFKLQSSIEFLREYFRQCVTVKILFCQGTEVLAEAFIHIEHLDTSSFDEQENFKIKYEEDCIFKSFNESYTFHDDSRRKPFISTQMALKRNIVTNDCYAFRPSKEQRRPREYGDSKKNTKSYLEIMEERCDTSCQTTSRATRIAKSAFTDLKYVSEINQLNQQRLYDDNEEYHMYNLVTTLKTIEWKIPPENGFQFRFLHPKANTVLIVQCNSENIVSDEPITLEDVKCNQYFVSTPSNITTLIYTYPCKIVICNSDNTNFSEQFELYTKLFLTQKAKIIEGIDACTCSYFAMINRENNEDDIICELQIEMTINDFGVSSGVYEKSCFDLEPMILDERLAFKTLNEVNSWKKIQQKRFDEKLKHMESVRLKDLNFDWENKRTALEIKLKTGIEKCRVLSEDLVRASKELENKQKLLLDSKNVYHGDPEFIEMKVTEMLEKEMNEKLQRIKQDNIVLLDKINTLSFERDQLNDLLVKKDTEIEDFKRSTLTEEQTSSLLQELRNLEEKYRQELKAKEFFKEQWQKAVREVHILKSEDQRQIQMQIKKKKIELSQLSLQDFDKMSDSSGSTNSLVSCPTG